MTTAADRLIVLTAAVSVVPGYAPRNDPIHTSSGCRKTPPFLPPDPDMKLGQDC
jgi:hypothetical protein